MLVVQKKQFVSIPITTSKSIFVMRGDLPLFTTSLFLSLCCSLGLIGNLRMDFPDDMGAISFDVNMGGQ